MRLIALLRSKYKGCPGRKRDKNRQRVNIPAIASLDSPQVPRAQVMVSTIRKAKEGVKRHGRGYNSKMYSY